MPASSAQEPGIGAQLRALREAAGLSVSALARELGVSPSAVSQIERDKMRPSVSRLIAITDALGVPLARAFETSGAGESGDADGEPTQHVGFALSRAGQVPTVTLTGGVRFRRLSPVATAGVDFFESTYPPGTSATTDPGLFRHEGHEIGTVLSGALTIDFDDERVVLRPGDSISYDCSRPHRIYNPGDEPAVATWLIVHP